MVGLRNLRGAGVQQVVDGGLQVVLQPVEAMTLIEEIATRHDAFLNDGGVVVVVDEHVAVLRLQCRSLSRVQALCRDARLLLELQGDGRVVALEIHSERAAEDRRGGILARTGVLAESAPVVGGLELRCDIGRAGAIQRQGALGGDTEDARR
ncbi:hypothetical protein D9M68_813290 [compost metagenome]